MNEEVKRQIERKIYQGKLGDFLAELDELIFSTPPLSDESHLNEFEESVIYRDFLKEMQAWTLELEQLIITGNSEKSYEYLRGAHSGIKTAMGFTSYLRKQIEDAKQERRDNDSE